MSLFVLVHGAWHDGTLLEKTASTIRKSGHEVYTPTLLGNKNKDFKNVGLEDVANSLVSFITSNKLSEIILVGHSYGGMIITAVADILGANIIKRLVYFSAFVPLPGESLNDMVPPYYTELFNGIVQDDGSVMIPFNIWRETFINDSDIKLAKNSYQKLNAHPYKTFTDKIILKKPISEINIGKSYIYCTEDIAMPASYPWHPRLSEKLGLYRLVSMPGSHEVSFTNPYLLGEKIIESGRE